MNIQLPQKKRYFYIGLIGISYFFTLACFTSLATAQPLIKRDSAIVFKQSAPGTNAVQAAQSIVRYLPSDYETHTLAPGIAVVEMGGEKGAQGILEGSEEVPLDESSDPCSTDPALLDLQARGFTCEPDYILFSDHNPNDTSYQNGSQWALNGTYGIRFHQLSSSDTGSGEIVAVVDTGIDYNHPDLAANMWTNPGEIASNGIDDDGNGFIDDVRGWDFANNDNDPYDDNSHGTHVAGTIAGVTGNSSGIAGVAFQAKLVACKFLSGSGSGTTSNAIKCIDYLRQFRQVQGYNLRVTNNSWGGGGFSAALKTAIEAAGNAGQIFIAAAGNSAADNDITPHYPSSFTSDAILAVASHTSTGALSAFSCYGATSVDVSAPGSSILSTVPSNSYSSYSGTSMATPHVAGIAALLFARNPSLTVAQVKQIILGSVVQAGQFTGKVTSGGYVNAVAAVATAAASAPSPTPTFTPSATPTSTPTSSVTATATPTSSIEPTATSTPTPQATATRTPQPSPIATTPSGGAEDPVDGEYGLDAYDDENDDTWSPGKNAYLDVYGKEPQERLKLEFFMNDPRRGDALRRCGRAQVFNLDSDDASTSFKGRTSSINRFLPSLQLVLSSRNANSAATARVEIGGGALDSSNRKDYQLARRACTLTAARIKQRKAN